MKTCPYCGESIQGRSDKKFCSHYCKSAHHYQMGKGKEESLFRRIDTLLKTNRRILKQFNKAGKATVRKEVLLKEGFNPKYFTHYWKNSKGEVYLFCYEYGFLKVREKDKEKYVLVQWQPYMEK